MKVGDPLGGLVVPHSASKPYVINDPRYAKLSQTVITLVFQLRCQRNHPRVVRSSSLEGGEAH